MTSRWLLSSLALAVATTAAAQPNPPAEAAFRDGMRLMMEKRYAEACEAFAASDRVGPSIAAKMKLADCEEKRGRLATAWATFLDVASLIREDATRQAEYAVVQQRAAALEARLPHLTISVPEGSRVEGLVVARDGVAIDPGLWNRAIPVDRGAYTVTARAPGHRVWATTVTIAGDGEERTIEVPRFEVAARAMDGAAMGAREVDAGASPRSTERSWVWPGVLGATAVALGGVALGLELSARGRYDDAVASQDPTARDDLYDSAVARRRGAIGVGVGALAVAGVAGWLVWRGGRASATPAVAVSAGGGYVGVAIGGEL
jgi:hypothetical protein